MKKRINESENIANRKSKRSSQAKHKKRNLLYGKAAISKNINSKIAAKIGSNNTYVRVRTNNYMFKLHQYLFSKILMDESFDD